MKALTYIGKGRFEVTEKAKPAVVEATDAVDRVTLSSICTSDLHIKHGCVPSAVPGITVGHEMVGIVESVGEAVTKVKPGDRVIGLPERIILSDWLGRRRDRMQFLSPNFPINMKGITTHSHRI